MRLAELTTLRVGGEAQNVVEALSSDELAQRVSDAWISGEPWLLIGGGSNLLVSDDSFDGTVIRALNRGIERLPPDVVAIEGSSLMLSNGASETSAANQVTLRVHAGEPWDAVVAYAVANSLSGIEALSGIPGSAGAAPIQNIGAYGQELADTLASIEFLDFQSGERLHIPADQLELGYRTSAMKQGRLGVVLSIDLRLDIDELSQPVAYDQLATALEIAPGERAPLAQVRNAVLALRASKGMVLSVDDPDSVSAGSFFTNPIVTENFARGLPRDAPRWILDPDAPESLVKLSAAWLIEHAGIRRGYSLPGSAAAISSKHTLALVNTGGASAEQIAELARFVHLRVLSEFGVKLQPEPQLIGIDL